MSSFTRRTCQSWQTLRFLQIGLQDGTLVGCIGASGKCSHVGLATCLVQRSYEASKRYQAAFGIAVSSASQARLLVDLLLLSRE